MKSFIKNIFSITNSGNYKVITVLFFSIKIKRKDKTPYLVVIDPGGIGDYMFCRPYFKYLKKAPKYKNYKIIYITKDIYVDMTKCYDIDSFDKVVGYNSKNYKNVLNVINKTYNVTTLINLRCIVHEENKDWNVRYKIAKGIKAKQKIVSILDVKNKGPLKNLQFNIYSKIIYSKSNLFELERRRIFFEEILEIPIPITNKELNLFYSPEKNHIAVSIMAIDKGRQYSEEKWIPILNYLLEKTPSNTELLFLGIESEYLKIQKLINKLQIKSRCINIAGKIPISILPMLLKNCQFLLSVETGTVHIAESVGCKTICLCNGSYFGRFQPYKGNIVKYVYPKSFNAFLADASDYSLLDFYGFNPKFSMETITFEDVRSVIDKMMNEGKTC